jgi:hypothetical protein
MRASLKMCRNGHKLAGDNLLWHTRYTSTREKFLVRECRRCANDRYRAKRNAAKRNRALAEEALASAASNADAA